MYPNTKVLMEAEIFCPGGTDLLVGSVLVLLGNMEELLSSSEVLLVLGTRFLHGRTMKRGGSGIDMVVIAGCFAGDGEMFFVYVNVQMVLY